MAEVLTRNEALARVLVEKPEYEGLSVDHILLLALIRISELETRLEAQHG